MASTEIESNSERLQAREEISSAEGLSTEVCLRDLSKLGGKVVLVTGAARGFGKEYALRAAAAGAKLVIGDLSQADIDLVVDEIAAAGGEAVGAACDVTDWDQQLALFEVGIDKFGRIDTVVVNAGIGEIGQFLEERSNVDGKPRKPRLETLQVNIIGAVYTVRLAFWALRRDETAKGRSIVLMGSMSSFFGIPLGPMYSITKHGMLGLARSVFYDAKADGISCSLVCPWFCPTKILPASTLFSLSGLPLTDAQKVVDAMLYASTTKDSGECYAVDATGVLRLPQTEMEHGTQTNYYTAFRDRAAFLLSVRASVRQGARIVLRARGWSDGQITAIKYAVPAVFVAGVAKVISLLF